MSDNNEIGVGVLRDDGSMETTMPSGVVFISRPRANDDITLLQAPEPEQPPTAPFAGQWDPTDEHETKFGFRFGRGRITITVTHDPFRDDDVMRVRRWLVDSLKAWPHPDAPRTDDEADYPVWRERCYRDLCEEKTRR